MCVGTQYKKYPVISSYIFILILKKGHEVDSPEPLEVQQYPTADALTIRVVVSINFTTKSPRVILN